MMSQTSAETNANINPPGYMEIHFEEKYLTESGRKLLEGWEHWSLEDVNKTLEVIDGEIWGAEAGYLGRIIFNVLLKAANDPEIPFEAIEGTVLKTLNTRGMFSDDNPFTQHAYVNEKARQGVCNFFKAFVKHGQEDARYYDLIYTMLTHQIAKNKSFPLGFQMVLRDGFNKEVLAELPQEMQERLRRETFNYDDDGWNSDGRTCYSLLTGNSIGM